MRAVLWNSAESRSCKNKFNLRRNENRRIWQSLRVISKLPSTFKNSHVWTSIEVIPATVKRRIVVITVVLVLALEIFVTFHHQTIRKTCCLVWPVALVLLCQSVSSCAAQTWRYPLHETQPRTDSRQPDNEPIRFAALPKMNADPVEKATNPAVETPVALPKNEFSSSFESAYKNIGGGSQLPTSAVPRLTREDFRPTPLRVASNVVVDGSQPNHINESPSTRPIEIENVVEGQLDLTDTQPKGIESVSGHFENSNKMGIAELVEGLDDSPVWWKQRVLKPMLSQPSQQSVNTNTLVYDTLKRSPRIRALSQTPLVREGPSGRGRCRV